MLNSCVRVRVGLCLAQLWSATLQVANDATTGETTVIMVGGEWEDSKHTGPTRSSQSTGRFTAQRLPPHKPARLAANDLLLATRVSIRLDCGATRRSMQETDDGLAFISLVQRDGGGNGGGNGGGSGSSSGRNGEHETRRADAESVDGSDSLKISFY